MASDAPVVLTVTIFCGSRKRPARAQITGWSVASGRYGSQWARELALGDKGDVLAPAEALRRVAVAILDTVPESPLD